MDRHDHSHRQIRRHQYVPDTERLETRQVPSLFAPFSSYSLWPYSGSYGSYSSSGQLAARAAFVRHEYDQYVGELKTLELKSQATPAEFLALRDDARSISAAASVANLPHAVARKTAVDVSLQLDRAPLYGAAKDSGWTVVANRLTTNLDALDVPQPLIAQTLDDMKTLAISAGVTAGEFQTFTNDFYALRDAESSLPPNRYYHFKDPGLFYSQHLRGFFRGWGVQKVAARSTLQRNLRAIQIETNAGPGGVAALHRDAHFLESLGATVPSATNRQLDDAYIAAFDQGAPSAQEQSELRSNLVTILGPAGIASRVATVDRLVADAPTFAVAAGRLRSTFKRWSMTWERSSTPAGVNRSTPSRSRCGTSRRRADFNPSPSHQRFLIRLYRLVGDSAVGGDRNSRRGWQRSGDLR